MTDTVITQDQINKEKVALFALHDEAHALVRAIDKFDDKVITVYKEYNKLFGPNLKNLLLQHIPSLAENDFWLSCNVDDALCVQDDDGHNYGPTIPVDEMFTFRIFDKNARLIVNSHIPVEEVVYMKVSGDTSRFIKFIKSVVEGEEV